MAMRPRSGKKPKRLGYTVKRLLGYMGRHKLLLFAAAWGPFASFQLSLHPPGAVSGHQALDLVGGGQVEIQLNGLLETGCGGGILDGLLGAVVVHDAVEQAGGEGISPPTRSTRWIMYCLEK